MTMRLAEHASPPRATLPDDVHAAGAVYLGRREREGPHRRNVGRGEDAERTGAENEAPPSIDRVAWISLRAPKLGSAKAV